MTRPDKTLAKGMWIKAMPWNPDIHMFTPWYELYADAHPYVGARVGEVRIDPDGVQVQRYEHVTVYRITARTTFEIQGAIRNRYDELGGRNSWLGLPVSSEFDYDGGRAGAFQNGAVYWWPDVGAIDINHIALCYMGFMCWDETYDGIDPPGHDEVYAVASTISNVGVVSYNSRVYEGVDAGEAQPEWGAEIYRGPPIGLILTIVLRERDEGNPDAYRRQIDSALRSIAQGAGVGAGYIPIVGPIAAPTLTEVLTKVGEKLAPAVSRWVDTDDDTIGAQSIVLTAKDLCVLARQTPETVVKGVTFRFKSRRFYGHESHYEAAFNIWPQ